jgi:hypothetical protein
MSYEQVKEEIQNWDEGTQKRLIMEVVPEIWRKACTDESCAHEIKGLVDNDIVRPYHQMHMFGI